MTFLDQVLEKILERSSNHCHKTYWIVPSIRVGRYILKNLSVHKNTNFLAPKISTFPEFIAFLAPQISLAERIDILFWLYEIHQEIEENPKSFDVFYPWAELLFQDFNSIDQAMVDAEKIFENLKNYQKLDSFLEENASNFLNAHVQRTATLSDFLEKIPIYYQKLQVKMQDQQQYYTGALLRLLAENPKIYQNKIEKFHFFYFIGFAVFSKAERTIVAFLHQQHKVQCFFQIDEYFIHQPAGQFFTESQDLGAIYLSTQKLQNDVKKITCIASTSQAAQLGQVRKIIHDLAAENGTKALILAQETLVNLLMHDLPEDSNIAPGLSVLNSQSYFLIQKIFTETQNTFISLEFLEILLQHPLVLPFLDVDQIFLWKKKPQAELLALSVLKNLVKNNENSVYFLELFSVLWEVQKNEEKIYKILYLLSFLIEKTNIIHEQEALFLCEKTLKNIYLKTISIASNIKNLKTYFLLFQQALENQNFDFQGHIFSGLQVMGFLETRALDFEHLIISSLEEGVFPTTKHDDSLIPYTLKKYYHIPTYQKAEALSAYYFYRLLIYAKNIYLLYDNTKAEPSRFVRQVEEELVFKNKNIQFIKTNSVNYLPNLSSKTLKTDDVIQENLKTYFAKGLSASAFCTLLRCPVQFYLHHVLAFRKKDETAMQLQQNLMGEWVHQALKEIYTPILKEDEVKKVKYLLKKALSLDELRSQLDRFITEKWQVNFMSIYHGKNALLLEVTIALIQKWLNYALKCLDQTEKIYPIWALEESLTYTCATKFGNLSLVGQIDCVQKGPDFYKIIDYKTAFIRPEELHWNFSKNFFEPKNPNQGYEISAYTVQLLWYSLLYQKNYTPKNLCAGVYSLQNLEVGFLQIDAKNPYLSEEILSSFQTQMIEKLEQLFEKDFIWEHSNYLYCDFC